MPSFTFYFLRYANYGQQTDCCYKLHHRQLAVKVNNRASTLRLVRVQPRVKTAVCDVSFSRARFHATADRYRCFFSGWPHNYAWITCFSARKSLKQRIGTPTHTVLYPTDVFFGDTAKHGPWTLDWTGLDWTGLDWTGLDWTGLDWTGLDWTGLDWTGLDWTGLDWTGLDWTGLDWTGLDWTGLDWTGLDWTGLDWTGLDWTGLDWTGLDWTGLDWTGLDWTGLDWTGLDCIGLKIELGNGK